MNQDVKKSVAIMKKVIETNERLIAINTQLLENPMLTFEEKAMLSTSNHSTLQYNREMRIFIKRLEE